MSNSNLPKIKSVAIIGGGPAGIAASYEFTRALKNGTSAFGHKSIKDLEAAKETYFDKVVVFERNPDLGGVWAESVRGSNNTDPEVPDFETQTEWSNPKNIFTKRAISDDLEKELNNSSYETPVVVEDDAKSKEDLVRYQWRSSAAYDGLFTNVTNRYMSFSFDERSEDELKRLAGKYKHLKVFQSSPDVTEYLQRVVKDNDLERYFRYNSNVERVRKLDNGKWEVTVNILSKEGDNIVDKWYSEQFDAIVIANGKTVPKFPNFPNLKEFYKLNRDKVNITHAKALKNIDIIRNSKKLLLVGSSVSGADLAQYAFPRDLDAGTVFLSRKTEEHVFEWITNVTHAHGIVNKPEIEKFLPEENAVQFTDGSIEKDFDVIVIATGYHSYFPFFEKNELKTGHPLSDFYLFTFSPDEPTVGLVGNNDVISFFHGSEAQASALAGLWSGLGNDKLPSKQVQEEWIETEGQVFVQKHVLRKRYIDPLIKYSLKGTPNPFDYTPIKADYVHHLGEGLRIIEDVWFKLRDGELTQEQVTGQ